MTGLDSDHPYSPTRVGILLDELVQETTAQSAILSLGVSASTHVSRPVTTRRAPAR
jgi:hypothetical protein